MVHTFIEGMNPYWAMLLSMGLADGMTLGLSSKILEHSDPNKVEQYALAKKEYPIASDIGEVAGWMLPGAGKAAGELMSQALKPVMKPIVGAIGKGAQAILGKVAPKAVSVLESAAANAISGGASGYGLGALQGGLESIVEGNSPKAVIRDANETGLQFAGPSAAAGGLLGAYNGFKGVAGGAAKGAGDAWGSTNNLIESATMLGKGGVSPVGRAFQKHAGNPSRAGTFVGEASGNATKNTEQGAKYISDILKNSKSTYKVRHTDVFGDILDVRLPDGTGARWSADGKKFIGFLEKYSK